MRRPARLVRPQIGRKLLAAPVAGRGVADRRKGRHGREPPRKAHRDGQGPVPAHRMPGDRLCLFGHRKGVEQQARQFLGDMIPHPEIRGPGCLGRVHIKPRPLPQIKRRIIGHPRTARAGIGKHQRNPRLGSPALCAGLDHRILMRAGQPRQIPKQRHRPVFSLLRQKQPEGHIATAYRRGRRIHALHAAKRPVFRYRLHCPSTKAITPVMLATDTTVEIRIAVDTLTGATP